MADSAMGSKAASGEQVMIACPTDAALNRVPLERVSEHPKCGKCHSQLFQAHALDLTSANFDQHVLKSELPIVIDLWAEWCGPCRMMSPNFEAAAARLEPRVRMAKLDTEAEAAIANRYNVRGIPTMIMLHRGKEVARISGAMQTSAIVQWVDQQLAKT